MVYLLKWALCTIVTAVGRAQTSSQKKQLSPSKTRYRVSESWHKWRHRKCAKSTKKNRQKGITIYEPITGNTHIEPDMPQDQRHRMLKHPCPPPPFSGSSLPSLPDRQLTPTYLIIRFGAAALHPYLAWPQLTLLHPQAPLCWPSIMLVRRRGREMWKSDTKKDVV